jgi:hypothetical protein
MKSSAFLRVDPSYPPADIEMIRLFARIGDPYTYPSVHEARWKYSCALYHIFTAMEEAVVSLFEFDQFEDPAILAYQWHSHLKSDDFALRKRIYSDVAERTVRELICGAARITVTDLLSLEEPSTQGGV